MVLVVTVIATVIVYFVVLDTQNVGTLFLLFFLIFEFGISMIMFAFIFTTLFSNAKVDLYPIFHLLQLDNTVCFRQRLELEDWLLSWLLVFITFKSLLKELPRLFFGCYPCYRNLLLPWPLTK